LALHFATITTKLPLPCVRLEAGGADLVEMEGDGEVGAGEYGAAGVRLGAPTA
jgi:hypothetical protein